MNNATGQRSFAHLVPWRRVLALVQIVTAAWFLASCGYVRVRITASPLPPTSTARVSLSIPERRATATAVPSTPLPTATPTPTPTPIVHVVQKGDLLIHIASQYNVSMQTIIDVNGITNPHALPIGRQLIIPRSEEEALALRPTATPTPVPMRMINVGLYRTPTGSLWCMGEVANDRDEALDLAQVQVSLYNAGGELLDRAAAFTVSDIVPGHGVAPFAVLLPNAPAAGFVRYEIELLSAQTITHWGRRHRTLTVDSVSEEMNEGALVVQGIVRNRGEAKARDVRVTLTAYGDDGTVVGVRQTEVTPLPAGEEQEFSLSLIPAAPVSRTQAVVWGMKEVN